MLTCFRVRQFAIIDALEVEFGPGLNVVTGETGAGKSILVGALELVLGGRAKADAVRSGADRAEVEALFETGEGELVLRRSVLATGRSRAYVNGSLATVAQLATLAEGLVDISSQHEHHTLVDAATHLDFLDAYAVLAPHRATVKAAHRAVVDAARTLEETRALARNRTEREDLLRYQLSEIDALDLQEGELEALTLERDRLNHAESLVRVASGVEAALYADDGAVCEELARIGAELSRASDHDPQLLAHVDAVEGARVELEEVARQLGAYAHGVEMDPHRLEAVADRLHLARQLVRKYGGDEAALFAHRDAATAELATLDATEARLEALEAELQAAIEVAATAARELSSRRRTAAGRLAVAFTGELQSLGMGGARVEVEVAALEGRPGEVVVDGARLTATGCDRAEFLIAPNPGESPRPLRKVASGGELSRSLLALKRVLAGQGPVGLYVFDEVDAGVGGAVAEVIGRKLKSVAQHHQVLCITHLPQIAAYADVHFKVVKQVEDGRTHSAVTVLSESERLEEVSRMLGGLKITDAARSAAADLIQSAAAAG